MKSTEYRLLINQKLRLLGEKMSFTKSNPHPTFELKQQQKAHLSQRLIMSAHMQQAIKFLQLPLLELESYIEEQIAENPLLERIDENSTLNTSQNEQELPEKEISSEKELMINEKDFSILQQLDDDFKDYIEEGNQNPIRRSSEEDKLKAFMESSIPSETGLYGHFMHLVNESFEEEADIQIGEILIGYLDEYGFLTTPLQEIGLLHNLDEKKIQKVLTEIQEFEPYGIGASSIQDSLLIQLRCLHKKDSLAYRIIQECYEDLLHNRLNNIQKKLKCSLELIQKAINKDIILLNLHPGLQFSIQKNQPIVPEVILRLDNDNLIVEVNRDYTPGFRLNRKYLKMLTDDNTPIETKKYIKTHIFSARWLSRNLQHRYSTIERITEILAHKQREYFLNPEGKLIPLTMKVVADELKLHESTIARTVAHKYIDTPRGLIPLRAFFTSELIAESGESLSSETIREAITEMIEKESKLRPYSDQKISELLKEKGMLCARRTVAKYRELLNLGNAQQRKKFC